MPSRYRLEREATEPSRRFIFGARPLTQEEEFKCLAARLDRAVLEDRVVDVPVVPLPPFVVVVVAY